MKVTLILEEGKIIGTIRGQKQERISEDEEHAELLAGPGQKFHEIEIPDDRAWEELPSSEDVSRFHKHLEAYLPMQDQ